MTRRSQFKGFLLGCIVAAAVPALAATFNLFSPATGVLKGNASTYVTTAAASSDITGLWTGTCNSTTFLRADGQCIAAGGASLANPTASVGLTAVNGVAATAMRSDAAPPIDQAITPTWTGAHSFTATTTTRNVLPGSTATYNIGANGNKYNNIYASSLLEETGFPMLSFVGNHLAVAATGWDHIDFGDQTGATVGTYTFFGTGTTTFKGAVVGNTATGGAQGAGTGNFTGLYINGVAVGTGGGTVSSVGMSVPSFLSVSGSPVTTTGTLAVTLSGTALPVANGGTGTTTSTGTGNTVLSASPTFTGTLTAATVSATAATVGGSNVCRADGTDCPAAGATQTSGTFTITMATGCTTTPTATAKWVKTGTTVIINIGSFGTCTSNTTLTASDTSIPVGERPTVNQCTQTNVGEDNGLKVMTTARVTTTGTIDWQAAVPGSSGAGGCGGAGWTSSGTKGLSEHTITYQTAN